MEEKTKKIKEKPKKEIIGRLERVDLPSFNLFGIEAKIDTGAYNGSIHVSSVEEVVSDDRRILKFVLLDSEHPEFKDKVFETDDYDKGPFTNSSGDTEIRYIIFTKLILKGKELDVKLSLSDRAELRYPILLGRKAIKRHFVIDAAKKFTKKLK
jgi:hypothetical protein